MASQAGRKQGRNSRSMRRGSDKKISDNGPDLRHVGHTEKNSVRAYKILCAFYVPMPRMWSYRNVTDMITYINSIRIQCGAKKTCMFEFPAFLPPTYLGLPMHSPSAMMNMCH